jgi:hypothetical protein
MSVQQGVVKVYMNVAIHALASMPLAPCLSEGGGLKNINNRVPCLYALQTPQAFSKNIAIALDTSACHSTNDEKQI